MTEFNFKKRRMTESKPKGKGVDIKYQYEFENEAEDLVLVVKSSTDLEFSEEAVIEVDFEDKQSRH